MAAGNSYKVLAVPGEVLVIGLGTSAAPSVVFGNPDMLGGMNDGFYATSTPTIGISINGSSVATWSASGMVTGTVATSGAISSSSSILSSSPTAGVGYTTGAGGAATQGTDKSTTVVLSTLSGSITLNNASLAASALVSFTVTNTAVTANDVICVNHGSAGTGGPYRLAVNTVTAGSFKISVHNHNGTALAEAIVITYVVIKGVAA